MNTTQHEVAPRESGSPAAEAPKAKFRTRTPRVDVTETAEAYAISADLPGVPMADIDVTVEENRLALTAKRTPVQQDGHDAAFRQYGEGDYYRAFSIPEDLDRTEIRADLRDGVLRVTLPKAKKPEPQTVKVQIG